MGTELTSIRNQDAAAPAYPGTDEAHDTSESGCDTEATTFGAAPDSDANAALGQIPVENKWARQREAAPTLPDTSEPLGRGPTPSGGSVTPEAIAKVLASIASDAYRAVKPVIDIGTTLVNAVTKPSNLVLDGSDADKKTLHDLVETIRASGPKGKAFIESLENGATKTHLHIATTAEKKDGTVLSLASLGGGVTLRPSESKSGDNEVFVDPKNLINYTADDGSTAKETPAGLLLHEMGHAKLLNDKDPDQTSGGANAEKNVRNETNPIRKELGMKAER